MGSSRLFSHLSTKPSAARKMLLPFELLCLQGSPEASLARATCVSGSSPAEPLAVGLLLGGAWEHQEGSATEQDQGQEMDSVTRRLTGKDAWCLLVRAPLPQPCEALTGLHLPLVTSPSLFLSCLAPAPRSPQPRPHGLQVLPGTGLSSTSSGQALGGVGGCWKHCCDQGGSGPYGAQGTSPVCDTGCKTEVCCRSALQCLSPFPHSRFCLVYGCSYQRCHFSPSTAGAWAVLGL